MSDVPLSPRLRRLIGVMGAGNDEHAALAEPLGRWIAEQSFDLLTGGGPGVMAAVCRGFQQVPGRRGVAIGVLPAGPPKGYPNPWIDLAILTHLPQRGKEGAGPMSRNHINILSSAVVIALPGGDGTRTEVELALHYRKPLIAFLGADGRIEGMDRAALTVAVTLDEVTAFVWRQLG